MIGVLSAFLISTYRLPRGLNLPKSARSISTSVPATEKADDLSTSGRELVAQIFMSQSVVVSSVGFEFLSRTGGCNASDHYCLVARIAATLFGTRWFEPSLTYGDQYRPATPDARENVGRSDATIHNEVSVQS